MKKAAACFRQTYARDGGAVRWTAPDPNRSATRPVWAGLERSAPLGLAFMFAYQATDDPFYLELPGEAARALAHAQLASGGWHHKMNDDPERAKTFFYRRDVEAGDTDKGGRTNLTVFDDDVSQSAARLLMLYDRATKFKDEAVHHACLHALTGFAELQYSSGGWPMWVERSKQVEAVKAHYPESWPRKYPRQFYPPFYTINDNAIPGVIDALLMGFVIYGDKGFYESACRGGDFLLLARMPEPQPGWCQQYTLDMAPAWARKFEPPALVSYESVHVIETLMKLYIASGEEKYRRAIGPALAWLERSRLPDGRLARFYELKTNRPLYFTTQYELVYTDDDLPTHYRFQIDLDLAGLRARFEKLDESRRAYLAAEPGTAARLNGMMGWPARSPGAERVREVIDALDDRGAWDYRSTAPGKLFENNFGVLTDYVMSHHKGGN